MAGALIHPSSCLKEVGACGVCTDVCDPVISLHHPEDGGGGGDHLVCFPCFLAFISLSVEELGLTPEEEEGVDEEAWLTESEEEDEEDSPAAGGGGEEERKEQKVLQLPKCPVSPTCGARIDFTRFQSLIPDEQFVQFQQKFGGLLKDTDKTETAGDDMANRINLTALQSLNPKVVKAPAVSRCPKCNAGGRLEVQSQMGICSSGPCSQVFCLKCGQEYHGMGSCAPNLYPTSFIDDEEEDSLMKGIQDILLKEEQEAAAANIVVEEPDDKEECCICLTRVNVEDIVDFGCEHASSCRTCVKEYLETSIREGEVARLKCPQPNCSQDADRNLIEDLVDPLIFERLESLWMHGALRDNPEIVRCPKPDCQRYIYADPEHGYCEPCGFLFCTGCNEAYHGAAPCGMTEAEFRAYMVRYAAADEAERIRMEKEAKGKRKQENDMSEQLIKNIYKRCPTCKTDIEKTEGCNKMVCTSCNTKFCYLCGIALNLRDPYKHFGTTCKLFEVPPEV